MSIRGQFSSLDTYQVVQEINKSIAHHRMNNFYDVGPKTFVMRFGAADSKFRVVFEPGVRCHLTDVDHEKPKIPSYFTLMIRKNLRGWRIHSVAQVGRDRVIDFAFGAGDEPQFHIFLELWGQGNVILTDGSTKIISMWRTIKTNNNNENAASSSSAAAGDKKSKNGNNAAAASPTTPSSPAAAGGTKQIGDLYITPQESSQVSPSFVQVTKESLMKDFSIPSNQNVPLNNILPVAVYGSQLMKHISLVSAVDFSKSLQKLGNVNDDKYISDLAAKIASGFAEVDQAYQLPFVPANTSSSSTNGFAFSDAKNNNNNSETHIQQYLSFAKLTLKQFSNASAFSTTTTPTFSAAADLLFSAEERKKLSDIAKKQPTAQSREERCRAAIQRRIVELENEGAQRRKCANGLLLASDEVDKVIQLLSDALALGTNWKTLTEAIRRQREAAAEEDAKKLLKKNKQQNNSDNKNKLGDDDDDDKIDLGSSDDENEDEEEEEEENDDDDENEELFLNSDDEDEDEENGSDDSDDDDDGEERSAQERAADEQRYLLSLIYALDLRKNQMTLQLPDPDHAFGDDDDDDDEARQNEDDQDFRLGGPKLVLVVVDIGLTAHDNAAKYFELAKKADHSKSKTADKEEEAVSRAKQSGKNNNNSSNNKKNKENAANANQNELNKKKNAGKLPKQISVQTERQPAWFERHYWFITSMGDLVVIPKDAGQADVLIQKFANKSQDLVVMVDQFGSWPTLVKSRKAMAIAAQANNNNKEEEVSTATTTSNNFQISMTSLLEAAAATLCRSNTSCWVSNAALAKATANSNSSNSNNKNQKGGNNPVTRSVGSASSFWCPVGALTKIPDQGSGIKQIPQGAWNVMNAKEFKKPLQLAFSAQLCVALVEAVACENETNSSSSVENYFKNNASSSSEVMINVSEIVSKIDSQPQQPASPLSPNQNQRQQQPTMERNNSVSSIATTNSNIPSPAASTKIAEPPQQQSQKAIQQQQKKAKLIQKKYGEQDDEDRAIALALIGTKKSKAQEMLEQEDQLPTAVSASLKNPTSKKDKKSSSSKKDKNKNDDDDDDNDGKDASDDKKDKQDKKDKKDKASKSKKEDDDSNLQEPPQQQPQEQEKKKPQQQQPRQLSDDAQKNLQEKIQTAAADFLTMKYVDSSSLSTNNNSNDSPVTKKYLLPVLVPLLTMPLNKCRVLIVPGGEKRSELAKELNSTFFTSLGQHLSKIDEIYPSLVSKMQNDDILLQLPATAKIQTPFRASLVPLSALAGGGEGAVTEKVDK